MSVLYVPKLNSSGILGGNSLILFTTTFFKVTVVEVAIICPEQHILDEITMTYLLGNSAGDLFGMVKWPSQRLSDLQLGDKKVTLKHPVYVDIYTYISNQQPAFLNVQIYYFSRICMQGNLNQNLSPTWYTWFLDKKVGPFPAIQNSGLFGVFGNSGLEAFLLQHSPQQPALRWKTRRDCVWKNSTIVKETNISHLGKRKILFKSALGKGYVNCLQGSWWFQPMFINLDHLPKQRVNMESIWTHHPDKV